MGMLSRVTCTSCGYEAEVSGGPDCGMKVEVHTVSCRECRVLVDVLVAKLPRRDDDQPVVNYDPPMVKVRPRCPRSAKHHIELWSIGGPCPSCNAAITDSEPVALWD
jgi:hypothetical protein